MITVVVVDTQPYTFAKTHRSIPLKLLNLILYQSYLNKVD